MGFEWLGGSPEMERLRRLEGACDETSRELEQIRERGDMAADEYEELSQRLAVIAVWVRASLRHGGPQPPLEELEALQTPEEEPKEPGAPGK